MPFQARVLPLQHPPDLLPISLVMLGVGDGGVGGSAPAGIDPASEVPLQRLHFGLEAGTALPPGEVDVAAGAGGFQPLRTVLGEEVRFVVLAKADEVGFVEVLGVGAHAEVLFAVFDVALADVRSSRSVVCRKLNLGPKCIREPAFIRDPLPVLFIVPFTKLFQIPVTETLIAG